MPPGTANWQYLTPGLSAWVDSDGGWGRSNAGLLVAGDEALLIDTQWDERATRAMLDAAPLDAATITTLINTHADGDHTWGNAEVGAEEIISTLATVRQFSHEVPRKLASIVAIATAASKLPLVRLPGPARAMTETQLLARYVVEVAGGWQFSKVRLVPPTRAFSGELEFEFAGQSVRLIEVGPAHTEGDLIVHLPAEDVVFAADVLFVGVTPIMWAGPVQNWLAALDEIVALEPSVVVPGHGPVSGVAEVQTMAAYWDWAVELGEAQRRKGRTPAQAAHDAIVSVEFEQLPWGDWLSPERLLVNLHVLELGATGGAPASNDRAKLMQAMGVLVDQLQREARRGLSRKS